MLLCFYVMDSTSPAQTDIADFMVDLDMDAAAAPIDLSLAPLNVLTKILQTMCDKDRFTCALVCKVWAKAAAAATRSVMIAQPTAQTVKCLQQWLLKHGDQLVGFKLGTYSGAALRGLTALPCAQLQGLVLQGGFTPGSYIIIDSRVWGDIAAATKLTSLTLSGINTESQQADVVSALTALPDLEQLKWCYVQCSGEQQLSDSLLLQHLTKLTALTLLTVSAAALEHLGSLTTLCNLNLESPKGWAAAECPGLQELKALTRLRLVASVKDIPACVSQLTALQELDVWRATPTALISLEALTGLTQLKVQQLRGLSPDTPPPLQLPGLQHLVLAGRRVTLPVSFLASCTQLRVLQLRAVNLCGSGTLVASTMLQDLALARCRLIAADGAAGGPLSWQQVLPGPGRLPHLTSLQLTVVRPDLQEGDVECVACCSSLEALRLTALQDSFASGLAQLSGLTTLYLDKASDEQCGALAQLTGLRELTVQDPYSVSVAGLRHLAALEQLTSLGFGGTFDPFKVSCVLQQHMSDTRPFCFRALVNQVRAGGMDGMLAVLWDANAVSDCHVAPSVCRHMLMAYAHARHPSAIDVVVQQKLKVCCCHSVIWA